MPSIIAMKTKLAGEGKRLLGEMDSQVLHKRIREDWSNKLTFENRYEFNEASHVYNWERAFPADRTHGVSLKPRIQGLELEVWKPQAPTRRWKSNNLYISNYYINISEELDLGYFSI